jgi:VanZ family protein
MESDPSSLIWQLESLAAFSVSSFLLGRWLARRSPNQEIAAYAVVWLIGHVMWIPLLYLTTRGEQFIPGRLDLLIDAAATVIGTLCAVAGVHRMRARLTFR